MRNELRFLLGGLALLAALVVGAAWGQALPVEAGAPARAAAATADGARRNLLGEGAGFEVGPHGLNAYCAYGWGEPWLGTGTQPVFDDTVAHQGQFSLKLTAESYWGPEKRGRANYNLVWFYPVLLDPAKTYTLSAWMKADTAGMKATLGGVEYLCKAGAVKEVSVTQDWQRYAFTFKPEKTKLGYWWPVVSLWHDTIQGRLWIDDVQLAEGGQAGDCPAAPFAFGAAVDQPNKLFATNELPTATIKLRFRNNTTRAITCQIRYVIKDYWGKAVAQGTVGADVAANANSCVPLAIPRLPCGYYRADFDSADGRHHDEAIFGIYQPMADEGLLPVDWPLGCHNADANPIVRKLGFGWVRGFGGSFTFNRLCPQPGKFNFVESDIVVARCRQANLNLMPILGHGLNYLKDGHIEKSIPDWAVERKVKSSVPGSWAEAVVFPRLDAWKAYVKAVVSRYKGSIKAWEIMNEPNCWVTPEEYVPYLKAAYEAAKEADPDCLIVGGCATSDWGSKPGPWTRRMLELVQGRSLDVLSVHMYSDTLPERTLGNGTDQFLSYLKNDLLQTYGRDIPIWHTEKTHMTTTMGYSKAKMNWPAIYRLEDCVGFQVPDFRARAEFMLRETLIDSSIGKGPFFWYGDVCTGISIASRWDAYSLSHTENDGSPCPELLAANGLARMLEGRSTPQELLKLGFASSSLYAALYEGPKGALAALWDCDGTSSLGLAPDLGAFTLCNFFGVPLPAPAGGRLELGTAPVYLLFDGVPSAVVKRWLLKSTVDTPRLSFSGGLEQENGSPLLALYAFNKGDQELTANLKLRTVPDGWSLKSSAVRLPCPPGQISRATVPVTALKSSSQVQAFTFSGAEKGAALAVPPFPSATWLNAVLSNAKEAGAGAVTPGDISIDGALAEWSAAGVCGAATAHQVIRGRERWQGPLDLSCELRFRWDKNNLYVGAIVYDDVVERSRLAPAAYESDSLEFFLGLDAASRDRAAQSQAVNALGPSDFQLILAPGMESGDFKDATAWCIQLNGDAKIMIASKRSPLGYTLEAAIPWTALKPGFTAEKGGRLLLCFQACDTDRPGEATRKKIAWTGDEGNHLSAKNWGVLTLQ